jgi:hypothetical protein
VADLFGKLVVRAAPKRRAWVLSGLILALLLVVYAIFELGRYEAGFRVIDSVRGALAASSRIRALEAENSRLRTDLEAADVARRVDREGYKQVERSLGDMQSEIGRLKQDLSFYRGLVQPDSLVHVKVQQMQIVPEPAAGQYRLKFVLMQTGKPEKDVTGSTSIVIDGLQGGKPRSLGFAEISPSRHAGLAYSFRYFQDYDEIVRLPKGFDPTRLGVEIFNGKDQSRGFRQAFLWKAQGMSTEMEANGGSVPKDSGDVQAETE